VHTSAQIVLDLDVLLCSHAVESGDAISVVVPVGGAAPGSDCAIGGGWIVGHFEDRKGEKRR